jgi:hypothetical protein
MIKEQLIKEFLSTLKYTIVVEPEWDGQSNAMQFYELVYELGRQMHLCPDKCRALLNDQSNKSVWRQTFQQAYVSVVSCTRGLVNNLEACDINIARTKLSELWFLRNEILELNAELDLVTDSTARAILDAATVKLDRDAEMLESQIDWWANPNYQGEMEEEAFDVPNLKGVPDSHHWWSISQRESCKDIQYIC